MGEYTKEQYISPDWGAWLIENQLNTFDDWWQLEAQEVDAGNYKADGWSKVYFFKRGEKSFYVKRQSNYLCRNYASPFFKVPTAKAEKIKIDWYKKANIPALNVVYFGWRKRKSAQEAILVTEELTGFKDLGELNKSDAGISPQQEKNLAKAIGCAIKKLHQTGIQHHNLYPKHILVKENGDEWQINFIDLETSRPHFGITRSKLRDMETLHRRIKGWSNTTRLRAFLAYRDEQKLSASTKDLIRRIQRRTQTKSEKS